MITLTVLGEPGIECDCGRSGAYLPPAALLPLSRRADGQAPGGMFTARLVRSFPEFDLEVRRTSNNRLVGRVANVTPDAAFGFSPDGRALACFYFRQPAAGISWEWIELLRMPSGTQESATVIWKQDRPLAASHGYGFSPKGQYFLFHEAIAADRSLLKIVDASTGRTALSEELTYFARPVDSTNDGMRIAGWGFSPDALDRSFVLGYPIAQERVQLRLVNLATGAKTFEREFGSETLWRFSPCGDVFGWAELNVLGQTEVWLRGTEQPGQVAGRRLNGRVTGFEVRDGNHLVLGFNGIEALGPSTAAQRCDSGNPPSELGVAWVDFAYAGPERGSEQEPFRSLAAAVQALKGGGLVYLRAGSSSERLQIAKPMELRAVGGAATIGSP